MHIARRECWRLKSYFLKPTIFWTFWTRCTRGFWLLLAVLFLHLANALTSTVPMQALSASAPAALPAQGTSCQAGTQAPAWEWDHDYFNACTPCFCFRESEVCIHSCASSETRLQCCTALQAQVTPKFSQEVGEWNPDLSLGGETNKALKYQFSN